MATHFDPYPDDDEAVQAPCGTWLGEASNSTSNWADVDCRLCWKLKVKISADHEASEAAIVEQMGDMAAYMRLGIPTAELEAVDDPVSSSASKKNNHGVFECQMLAHQTKW